MKIQDVYLPRMRGPWFIPAWLELLIGHRERAIMQSHKCEQFPHKFNKDTDDYMNNDCVSYYCPDNGQFTINVKAKQIVG